LLIKPATCYIIKGEEIKLSYPQRTNSHLTETASWKILQNKIPDEWIVRELSERDYGIDAYIEIVQTGGDVTGNLCSIQLKGTNNIDWRNNSNGGGVAKLSGIAKSTVNYWMNLPMPVFLVWADINKQEAYYSPVKTQIRKQYNEYLDEGQATLGFNFMSISNLGTPEGIKNFLLDYDNEKHVLSFPNYLRGILIHLEEYFIFIVNNQGLDPFMGVDDEKLLMMEYLYEHCNFLSSFLEIKWDIISLAKLYENDMNRHGNCYELYNDSLDNVLKELTPVFFEIIKKGAEIIAKNQSMYWMCTDIKLFNMCSNLDLSNIKNLLKL